MPFTLPQLNAFLYEKNCKVNKNLHMLHIEDIFAQR